MDDAQAGPGAHSAPAALWLIALLALSPFPLAALLYGYGPAEYGRPALTVILSWSAVVLSFLGGVRWGLESAEPQPRLHRLALSVAAPATAFAVFLGRGRLPDGWILSALIAIFILQWLFDHQAPDTPARYPKLSTTLTAGACLSLAVVLEKAISG